MKKLILILVLTMLIMFSTQPVSADTGGGKDPVFRPGSKFSCTETFSVPEFKGVGKNAVILYRNEVPELNGSVPAISIGKIRPFVEMVNGKEVWEVMYSNEASVELFPTGVVFVKDIPFTFVRLEGMEKVTVCTTSLNYNESMLISLYKKWDPTSGPLQVTKVTQGVTEETPIFENGKTRNVFFRFWDIKSSLFE